MNTGVFTSWFVQQNIINNLEAPYRNHCSKFPFNHFFALLYSFTIMCMFLNNDNNTVVITTTKAKITVSEKTLTDVCSLPDTLLSLYTYPFF